MMADLNKNTQHTKMDISNSFRAKVFEIRDSRYHTCLTQHLLKLLTALVHHHMQDDL